MMNKKEILETLKVARDSEEKAVPIYSGHLESAVFWAGISGDKAARVKEVLEILKVDSTRHKNILEKLIRNLQEGF